MELTKGMYVRDDFEGIGKVNDICTCEQCKERGFYEPIISYANHTEYVSSYNNMQLYKGKASHKIIDLIEVGDYVNGSKVEEIHKDINGKQANIITTECYVGQENMEYDVVLEEDIKSIVTKEQFESMQYKVD